ncbi:ZIP family metal transporter [Candidatus Parcubacteria bacterium]|jgi:zinc and cadmium transporter|nr:ZIP family metal transporter [Candidatus Parcubacteria bacterium]
MLLNILLATIFVSLISLVGILVIFKKDNKKSFLKALISVAAGALLSVSLLDMLPEAIEAEIYDVHQIMMVVLVSIVFFFLLERVFHWHHCHCEDHGKPNTKDKKNLALINLVGDGIHNFVDGALIASAFLIDFHAGLMVTLAVVLHEIPQEISDFGVLLYAGLSKAKAIFYNLVTALIAVLGALLFYYFGSTLQNIIPLVLAFAAGNFIYLATADLIPELHHGENKKNIISHSIWLVVGVLLMYFVGIILPHS